MRKFILFFVFGSLFYWSAAFAVGVGEIVMFDNKPIGHSRPAPVPALGDYALAKVIKIWPTPAGQVHQLVTVSGGVGFTVNEVDQYRMNPSAGECLAEVLAHPEYYSCVGDEVAEHWGVGPGSSIHTYTIRSLWGPNSLTYALIVGQDESKNEVYRGYGVEKLFRFNHHKLSAGQIYCRKVDTHNGYVVYATTPAPNNPDICEGDKVSYPSGTGTGTGQVVAFFGGGDAQVLDQNGKKIFPEFIVK